MQSLLSFVTEIVDHWPSGRTVAMFHEWFSVRCIGPVFDLGGEPLRMYSDD